jgi:hypothetical protein
MLDYVSVLWGANNKAQNEGSRTGLDHQMSHGGNTIIVELFIKIETNYPK